MAKCWFVNQSEMVQSSVTTTFPILCTEVLLHVYL